MNIDQIALELYTVRDLAARDLPGTIRQVAELGYRAVEIAGLPPTPADELRRLFGDAGLTPVAAHVSIEELRANEGGTIERMLTLGCPRIIVPWIPESERSTPGGVREVARELGRIGEACARSGLRLGYHNHAFEFEQLDGTTVWDVLLEELPTEVDIELDVYWAAIGGRDPVDVIRDLGGRVRLLHMKDMAASSGREDVAPGDGTLPWQEIVDAGRAAGVEWYVVELDNPRDALADISRGLQHLRGLAATGEAVH